MAARPKLVEDKPAIGSLRLPRKANIVEKELPGKLSAIALRHTGVPLVEIRLSFPLEAGEITHSAPSLVLTDALFAGTEQHDRESLAEAVERLGGGFGASVSGDRVDLHAFALAAQLPEIFALVAEVLTSATYPAGEVRAERDRKADEVLIALSRPEVLAEELLSKRMFGRHPYGSAMPRPSALRRVGAEALRGLHRTLLHPASAKLVVVGDVPARRALDIATDELGPWLESGSGAVAALEEAPPVRPGGVALLDRTPSVQSVIRIGGSAPRREAEEWPALVLANDILGGMFTSRLVENLRERNGYTYSPRSRVVHGRAASTFRFGAEVSTEVTAAALVETRYELGRLVTKGITDEELEAARSHSIGSFLFQTATQSGLASTLAALGSTGSRPGYIAAFPSRLARCTRAEVEEAARRWLSPAAMATVVVGDAGAVSGPLSSLDVVTAA